jgi:hypothetical protein
LWTSTRTRAKTRRRVEPDWRSQTSGERSGGFADERAAVLKMHRRVDGGSTNALLILYGEADREFLPESLARRRARPTASRVGRSTCPEPGDTRCLHLARLRVRALPTNRDPEGGRSRSACCARCHSRRDRGGGSLGIALARSYFGLLAQSFFFKEHSRTRGQLLGRSARHAGAGLVDRPEGVVGTGLGRPCTTAACMVGGRSEFSMSKRRS